MFGCVIKTITQLTLNRLRTQYGRRGSRWSGRVCRARRGVIAIRRELGKIRGRTSRITLRGSIPRGRRSRCKRASSTTTTPPSSAATASGLSEKCLGVIVHRRRGRRVRKEEEKEGEEEDSAKVEEEKEEEDDMFKTESKRNRKGLRGEKIQKMNTSSTTMYCSTGGGIQCEMGCAFTRLKGSRFENVFQIVWVEIDKAAVLDGCISWNGEDGICGTALGGIKFVMGSAFLRSKGSGFEDVFQDLCWKPRSNCSRLPSEEYCACAADTLTLKNACSAIVVGTLVDPLLLLVCGCQFVGSSTKLLVSVNWRTKEAVYVCEPCMIHGKNVVSIPLIGDEESHMQGINIEFRFVILCSGFPLQLGEADHGSISTLHSVDLAAVASGNDRQIANQASRDLASLLEDCSSTIIEQYFGRIFLN
ncbi:hypothetical protein Tsubulata_026991 [Turnera subulata]|uniref:Uncharacterized protein n=1 Tax=Turnera subulata TaxID=218843 RepID=A0A9Q0FTX4_9ROSI|nr:hypothetical protein Tsubulata_026991 [Turnera subulata]